jgi:hypothetical protein
MTLAEAGFDHPAFTPLRPLLARLPGDRFPDCEELNRLAEAECSPVRFVLGQAASALDYERAVAEQGLIATRSGSWHDLFNALCWLAFPRSKTALNRVHVSHAFPGGARALPRDRATLLDESGALVLFADAGLAALFLRREWKSLFVQERAHTERSMKVVLLGHALYDKMRTPYKSLTAHALVLQDSECCDDNAALDAKAAAAIAGEAALSPLPLLGVPGWDPRNRSAGFYDDAAVFRPRARVDQRFLSASSSRGSLANIDPPAAASSSREP